MIGWFAIDRHIFFYQLYPVNSLLNYFLNLSLLLLSFLINLTIHIKICVPYSSLESDFSFDQSLGLSQMERISDLFFEKNVIDSKKMSAKGSVKELQNTIGYLEHARVSLKGLSFLFR